MTVRILDVLFRLGLGGIFIYASYSKIQDPALFASAVASYKILPQVLVGWVALVLPPLELIAGIALIVTKWSREAASVLFGLLLVFLVGLIQAWIRGLEISCGCFGPEDNVIPIWVDILRDLGLLLPTIWLVVRPSAWIGVRSAKRS